ncbi:MAG TPA: class I SAM-dependent methyltransferase [Pseudomonadales bacterium]
MSLTQIHDQAATWREMELPDSWPDDTSLDTFQRLSRIARQLISHTVQRVELPDNLPGMALPKYLLQEFHSLPNGNFSKNIAGGYIRSFDAVMLGTVPRMRRAIAGRFANAGVAVDIGCGGGHMARALKDAGIAEVWGIEPSPYLLQLAAKNHKDIKLMQGLAEQLELPDQCADLVTLCFVWHEIPPRYAELAIREIYRVLKPGGHLAFIEPSPVQMQHSKWQLLRRYGWRGVYFNILAGRVFEPFINAWHKRDIDSWLPAAGFDIIEHDTGMPLRTVIAQKPAS